MGYFANGTSGEIYEEMYCYHCIHYTDCPILGMHFLFNYTKDTEKRAILDWLIPRSKDGLHNEKCTMFYKGTPEEEEPHIPLKGTVARLKNKTVIKSMQESGDL